MNNTALKAEVQSTEMTHMVFSSKEHERFFLCENAKDEVSGL